MTRIIEDFIKQYLKELDYYREVARIVAQQCEILLEQNGIRAIVTHRVKRSDRLKTKLESRIGKKAYKTLEDVSNDIFDLAGVRIALYFPADRIEVDNLIKSTYVVNKINDFQFRKEIIPNQKSSWGYRATHYRINLNRNELSDSELKYQNANVEIQVASVLMHAWAEIEHDLVYKPHNYQPSDEEIEILDEFNGIVLLGEKVLNRLYSSIRKRVSITNFNNHYELASYLLTKANKFKIDSTKELLMGRADVLHNFLVLIDCNTSSFIDKQRISFNPELAIVQQVADHILYGNNDFYMKYLKSKEKAGIRTPYDYTFNPINEVSYSDIVDKFLTKWISFEKLILINLKDKTLLFSREGIEKIGAFYNLDEQKILNLKYVRNIREEIVHKTEIPSVGIINNSLLVIDNIVSDIE